MEDGRNMRFVLTVSDTVEELTKCETPTQGETLLGVRVSVKVRVHPVGV